MIRIKTFTPEGAERALKEADRQLRTAWNTYGFKRVDSRKTNDGFIIDLVAPELHWRSYSPSETDLIHLFGYCDELMDAQVI